ncbi:MULTISPECIES: hypothetical protein [unclassified Crossiella]|uniref:phage tail protein n=1 Tax=unclassified Crossiella TaxID=2620835 RepID=UPI001FFE60F2|nr:MULTISPECIES: hypothetical protein [unclassified Crossiella]MCK2242317.1 hypothetical protein [Crossiella sp. S99.2]MCK2254652.1 hypothetical protein [Crossiella sp. S99.1]
MAEASGPEVGSLRLRVRPYTGNFVPSLQRFAERTENRTALALPVVLDTSGLDRQAKAAAVVAQRVARVELAAGLDVRKVLAELAILARLATAAAPPVEIPVTVPVSAFARLRGQLADHLRQLSVVQRALEIKAELAKETPVRLALSVAALVGRLSVGAVFHLRAQLDRDRLGAAAAAVGKVMLSLTQLGLSAGGVGLAVGGLVSLAGAASTASGAVALLPAALLAAGAAAVTLKLGFHGLGDALSSLNDTKAFNEALKQLAPNARGFAVAVREIAPGFRDLRMDVQNALFDGMAKRVKTLGADYLPVLRTGLVDTASSLNNATAGFAAFAAEQQTIRDTAGIFGNSQAALFNLTEAVQPLLTAFRDVAAVASEFLPGLTAGAGQAAQKFAEFVGKARESGRLAEWISAGLETLATLRELLGNVVDIIGAVLKAGQDTGGGLLQIITQLTGQVSAFLRSAEGQQMLSGLFSTLASVASAVLPILLEVGKIVGTVVVPAIGKFITALLTGGGPQALLDALRTSLETIAPVMEPLGTAVSNLVAALAPLLPAIAELAGKLLTVLAEALSKIDWKPLVDGVLALFDALDPLLEPISTLITELGVLISDSLPQVKFGLEGVSVGVRIAAHILGFLISVVSEVIHAFNWLRSRISEAAQWIGDRIGELADWIGRKLDEAGRFFSDLGGTIRRALGDAGRWLLDTGRDMVRGLIQGIGDMARWVYDKVRDLARGAVDAIKRFLGISSPSKVFARLGRFTAEGFADGMTAGIPLALAAAARLAEAAEFAPPEFGPPGGTELAAGAPGGVVINVYPREGQSEESVAAEVARRLAFQGRFR